MKVGIIGAGAVGSACLLALVLRGSVREIILVNRDRKRAEGVVTDVSYLGGFTTYKVKLDSGAVVRSSMANTARLDIDAYSASQRVVAWFTPDDCVVLEQ